MFSDLLTAPVLGPIKGVMWLAGKLIEAAEDELLDEGRIRGQLLQLQTRLDVGDITEEVYDEQESFLLEQLSAIREEKARRMQQ